MLKNVDAANEKAKYLLDKMRERFPEKLCSIEIVHWEDESFAVSCKHCDNELILHTYRYISLENETRYTRIQMRDVLEKDFGRVLSNEIISW